MLQNLREKATGIVAFVIVGILVVSFALWGVQYYLHGSEGNNTIAAVNGNAITDQQLNAAFERLRQQLLAENAISLPLTTRQQVELKKEALQQLIDLYVYANAAQKYGFQISQEQINATILSMPIFQVNGSFSPSRFQQVLAGLLYTENQFINDLRQSLLVTQMNMGVIQSAFVLPNEIKQVAELMNQQRDFNYLVIPLSKFVDERQITSDMIKAYYAQHQDEFMLPAQVSIQYLELSLDQIQMNLKLTDQELRQYYNNNIDLFSTPQKWKLVTLLIRVPNSATEKDLSQVKQKLAAVETGIKNGESFSKLVSQYSDDKTSAIAGGVGQWVTSADLPALLSEVVNNLKLGQVSQPIQTEKGYEIVKLIAVQQAQALDFTQVKDKVENALRQQKAQQIFSDQSEQLANLTYTDPNSLNTAAKALGLTINSTDLFTEKGAKQGIAANPKVVQAAFADNVLKDGNNSDPISIADGDVIALRVKRFVPAHPQPLAEVSDQIKKVLVQDTAKLKAEQLGESIITALAKEGKLSALAQEYQLKLQAKTNVSRQMQGVDAQILRFAFNMQWMQNQPNVAGLRVANGDYVIVQLVKVTANKNEMTPSDQQYQVVKHTLESAYSQMDYNAFTTSLKAKAKIKISASQ